MIPVLFTASYIFWNVEVKKFTSKGVKNPKNGQILEMKILKTPKTSKKGVKTPDIFIWKSAEFYVLKIIWNEKILICKEFFEIFTFENFLILRF